MKKAIRELVELSHYAAQHPRFIQGGGGNCSVKFSKKMAVKASGFFLEDVSTQAGYVVVDRGTGQPLQENGPRVSMESNLHRILNTYVIHTHPIVVGALVCAKEGKKFFRKLFPGARYQWIDYASPGRAVFEKVKERLAKIPGGAGRERVLFLANHGFFVSARTKADCIALHEKTVRTLETFFGPLSFEGALSQTRGRFLSPDAVVYKPTSSHRVPAKQAQAMKEMQTFKQEVLGFIRQKKWRPAWLTAADVRCLLQMQEECYRRKLLEKGS